MCCKRDAVKKYEESSSENDMNEDKDGNNATKLATYMYMSRRQQQLQQHQQRCSDIELMKCFLRSVDAV